MFANDVSSNQIPGKISSVLFLNAIWQDFFIADGEGLPKGVVENVAASVQQILNLYSLDVRLLNHLLACLIDFFAWNIVALV